MANTMETSQPQTTASGVDRAKEGAKSVADSARQEATGVARDAGAHARELVGQTKEQLRQQAADQTDRLSSSLRDISGQLRAMGEGSGAPSGMVSDLTHQLTQATGNLADRLDQGGIDGALADVKRFARNRPGLFLAAAVGAGFVAGRMLKAMDTGSVVHAAKDAVSSDADTDASASPATGAPAYGAAR
jgi:hypothetical protein